jgi:uncharacterized coiled-coil protein SlyX
MLLNGIRRGARKWLALATIAMLTLTLLPTDGRCQESCPVLQVLIDMTRPKKQYKPQTIVYTFTPHCPMGICTGAACPSYCPENCTRCPGACTTAPCAQKCPMACTKCADCPKCQDAKGCCEDCPKCCDRDSMLRVGVSKPMSCGRNCENVRINEQAINDRYNEQLHRLCVEQECTIRQLAAVVSEMQKELAAMRREMQTLRNGFPMPPNIMPFAPQQIPMPMPMPNWAPPRGFAPQPMPMPTPMPPATDNNEMIKW